MQFTTLPTVENMGPSPAQERSGNQALSQPKASVLEFLQRSLQPTTATDIAELFGQHVNTIRNHLDDLVAAGLVRRRRATSSGRGRPAWLYETDSEHPRPDPRVSEYAAFAGALAQYLATTSPNPVDAARGVGGSWGRDIVQRSHPHAPRSSPLAARRAVVDILADLGFAPSADQRATTVALRRCPLLDVALQHPQVVCQAHLGLVRGALDELGGEPERTDLIAFAEPGACRLHLLTASADSSPQPA